MPKKFIILVVCGALAILAVILLIIYIAQGGSTDPKDIINLEKPVIRPKIELSIAPEVPTEKDVTIFINATIDNGSKIASITFPDGTTTAYTSDTKYIVKDNGEYTFTITSEEGVTATESIVINNIIKISSDNPYIPEGFTHVENTNVNSGYVIEDKFGNQYVWIPVKDGKLIRNNESNIQYFEDDPTSNGLYNSVAKYYGFYIARYEASKDNVNGVAIARSVKGKIPWSSVNYKDAYNASINTAVAYDYVEAKTALINSYAWDTTLAWLNISVANYSSSTSYGNYSGTILTSGSTETDKVNEIYDMAGNLREWTTESYDPDISESEEYNNENENSESKKSEYRVVRGGSANISKIANSRIGEKEDLSDTYWGFRIILYKE